MALTVSRRNPYNAERDVVDASEGFHSFSLELLSETPGRSARQNIAGPI